MLVFNLGKRGFESKNILGLKALQILLVLMEYMYISELLGSINY